VGDKWQPGRTEIFPGYGFATGAPSGSVYLTGPPNNSVYRVTATGLEFVRDSPVAPVTGFTGYSYSMNDRGDLLWYSNGIGGDTKMFVTRGGQTTLLLSNGSDASARTTIDGEVVFDFSNARLDELGRVFSEIHLASGKNAIVMWDGAWKTIFHPAAFQFAGQLYTQENGPIRTVGNRVFVRFSGPGLPNSLFEYTDGWNRVIDGSATQPDGRPGTAIGALDANRSGDVAWVSGGSDGWSVLAASQGKFQIVYDSRDFGTQDLPRPPDTITLQDDGTIYFGLTTLGGERLFFRSQRKPKEF